MPFWRAVLGYDQMGDEDLLDLRRRGPSFWFQQIDAPRPQRNRIHVDISVPHHQAEARVAAAIAAGGRLVIDRFVPAWWTLPTPRATRPTWPPGWAATDAARRDRGFELDHPGTHSSMDRRGIEAQTERDAFEVLPRRACIGGSAAGFPSVD